MMRSIKRLGIVGMIGILSIGLVACGSKKDADNMETKADEGKSVIEETVAPVETEPIETKPVETAPVETEPIETEPIIEEQITSGEDNFEVDMETVVSTAKAIKAAVEAEDLDQLAELVAYPTYVGFPEEGVIVETKEDFLLLDKEMLFTTEMKDSMKQADETALEPSMAGFTLTKEFKENVPSITFGMVKGALGITGINY